VDVEEHEIAAELDGATEADALTSNPATTIAPKEAVDARRELAFFIEHGAGRPRMAARPVASSPGAPKTGWRLPLPSPKGRPGDVVANKRQPCVPPGLIKKVAASSGHS
jgi:hypothetical protein